MSHMTTDGHDWSQDLDSEGSDTPRGKDVASLRLVRSLLSCPAAGGEEGCERRGDDTVSPNLVDPPRETNKRRQTVNVSVASLLSTVLAKVGKASLNNAQISLMLQEGNTILLQDALVAINEACGNLQLTLAVHSLGCLPYDLLGVCLSYLDLRAVLAASQVCKLWAHLCNSLTLWRDLCRVTWPRYTESAEMALVQQQQNPTQPVRAVDNVWWKQTFFTKRDLEHAWLGPKSAAQPRRFSEYTILKQDLGIHCIQFDNEDLMTGSGVKHEIGIWDMNKPHTLKGTLDGHALAVTCLHFDSQKVVSGSLDKTVRIWDRQTRTCSKILNGHRDKVWCVQFSGDRLVSGSSDKTVRVWDVNTGEPLWCLREHRTSVSCVRVSGRTIVSGSAGNTIRVWDVGESPVCLAKLKGHQKGVFCLQFDHSKIISGSLDNTLRVWDPRDRYSTIRTLCADDAVHENDTNKGIIYFAYDDTKVISGGAENLVMIWDMRMWRRVDTLTGHQHWITSLQFDDNKLVTGSRDRCAKMWHFR